MYAIYMMNFQYFYNDLVSTLEEAIDLGRKIGFEFSIWKDGTLVGSCSGSNLQYHPVK